MLKDVNEELVFTMAMAMTKNTDKFWSDAGPVVTVGEEREVLDGRHRVAAAKMTKLRYLDLNVPESFVEERMRGDLPPRSLESIAEEARKLVVEHVRSEGSLRTPGGPGSDARSDRSSGGVGG